jgi:hypothetical protein
MINKLEMPIKDSRKKSFFVVFAKENILIAKKIVKEIINKQL